MIILIGPDRKTDDDSIEKPWIIDGVAARRKIVADIKLQFVRARLHGLAFEQRLPGASVGVRDCTGKQFPRITQEKQANFDAGRRTTVRRIEDMCR